MYLLLIACAGGVLADANETNSIAAFVITAAMAPRAKLVHTGPVSELGSGQVRITEFTRPQGIDATKCVAALMTKMAAFVITSRR